MAEWRHLAISATPWVASFLVWTGRITTPPLLGGSDVGNGNFRYRTVSAGRGYLDRMEFSDANQRKNAFLVYTPMLGQLPDRQHFALDWFAAHDSQFRVLLLESEVVCLFWLSQFS